MTVGELIKQLQEFDKDKEVFMDVYSDWITVYDVVEDDDGVYLE